MRYSILSVIFVAFLAAACGKEGAGSGAALFKEDIAFLEAHTGVVVLSDEAGLARVAVNPDLQGRVMTSTAAGPDGLSFGWINRELIASGENNLHINAFGGEDRFWLGPEGGQFSIFFKKGDPFDLEHWFTPPPINEGAYEVVSRDSARIRFRKAMRLVNYSGTEFDLELDRKVGLLANADVEALGIPVPGDVRMVAFQSNNKITNTGKIPWTKDTGLLSVWILGMFNPSSETTVIIPFKAGTESERGPVVNDAYFGKVPEERLAVKNGVLYFSGDGRYRSKIGIPPRRALPFLGSYDAENDVLTIVNLTVSEEAADYVNSMWEIQENPFEGDVVNSYNDGPPEPGAKPLGPFYELESSSPAAALGPGESLVHVHTTIHFQGQDRSLDEIARTILGVSIEEIEVALRKN
jgi:hypothetical protein